MSSRRDNVPFDPYYFEKRARVRGQLTIEDTFRHIHRKNHWGGAESVSGEGASRQQAQALETALPVLLKQLDVDVLLDGPCGDFSWMRRVELPASTYVGADVVPELIAANRQRYGGAHRRFVTLDLTTDPLPAADLLLCRDALVHLSFADAFRVIENVQRSPIPYLLTTTFPACEANEDITTGDWRPLNLEQPPFNFPPPIELIDEECTEGGGRYRDKSLGLWRVENLSA